MVTIFIFDGVTLQTSHCRYCVRGKLVSVEEDTYLYVARIRSVVWGNLFIICFNARARIFPAHLYFEGKQRHKRTWK